MWIKTKGKMIKAVSLLVVKNYGSRNSKYVITAMSSAGGLVSNNQIIATFSDKQKADEELERMCVALEKGDNVYRVPDKYCEKLPRQF